MRPDYSSIIYRQTVERGLSSQELDHNRAILAPRAAEKVGKLSEHWADYASCHFALYEAKIGEDGVLGPAWEAIGASLIVMLNGETGRLDCGKLDGFIRYTLKEHGVEGYE